MKNKTMLVVVAIMIVMSGAAYALEGNAIRITKANPGIPGSQMAAKESEGRKENYARPATFYFSENGKDFFAILTDPTVTELSEMHVQFSPDNQYLLIVTTPRKIHPDGTKSHNGLWDCSEDYLYDIKKRIISHSGNFRNEDLPGHTMVKLGWKKDGKHTLTAEYQDMHSASAPKKNYTAEKWFVTSLNYSGLAYVLHIMTPLQYAINTSNIPEIKKLMKEFPAKDVKWLISQVQGAGASNLGQCDALHGKEDIEFTCPGLTGSVTVFCKTDKNGKRSLGVSGSGWQGGQNSSSVTTCEGYMKSIEKPVLNATKKQDFKTLQKLFVRMSKVDMEIYKDAVKDAARGNLARCTSGLGASTISIDCPDVPWGGTSNKITDYHMYINCFQNGSAPFRIIMGPAQHDEG